MTLHCHVNLYYIIVRFTQFFGTCILIRIPYKSPEKQSCDSFPSVRVLVMFHFRFVHYTFSLVWVAERPPFGK